MKDLTFFSIGLVIGAVITKVIKDKHQLMEELKRERRRNSPS